MATSINSTSGLDALTSGASAAATPKNQLGKDDFLKLLTAQLSNQDPLQPVDNQAFIAQLAQFASVEQLQGMSSRLDTLLLATASSTQLNTATLVGKNVLFKADGFDLTAGAAPSLQVTLPSRATSVTALVQDASGRTVRSLVLGPRDAGSFDLGWDGRDTAGNTMPAGHYTVKIGAHGADGADVTAQLRTRGLVSAVSFDGNSTLLRVGGAQVPLADVVEISQT